MKINLKYSFFFFLIIFKLNSQVPEWKRITKDINAIPSKLSVDSSTNSLLLSNGPSAIEGNKYYYCAIWDGVKFDSIAPFSNNYNVFQIIKYKGDFYANAYTKILKKTGTYNWTEIGSVKVGAAQGMSIYNNDLIVYGGFDSINNVQASCIAKFDGLNWSRLDTFHFYAGGAILTAEEFNGNLYIGGTITGKNGWCHNLGMYDGTKFVNVDNNVMAGGNSAVFKILKYKNALYMSGNFHRTKGNPGNSLVKWDGFSWDTLGGGITAGPNTIMHFTEYKNELYFVGLFYSVAGMYSPGLFKFDGNKFWGHDLTCTNYNKLIYLQPYQDTLYVAGSFSDKLCNDSARYIAKWMGNGSVFTNSVSVVGVNELNKKEYSVKVYPNPASNTLHFESEQYFEAGTEIEIANTLGQTVLKINYTNEIDVSSLSPGYYILKIISSDKRQFHSKFLKE